MDWNDILTLVIAIDTIVKLPALPVGGYFLWRWWQKRHRVGAAPLVHPEQPVQAESSVETVTTTNAEGTTWVGYGERNPE